MHRVAGQQSLFCRRTSVDESAQRARTARDIEEEASVFSAELLMPRWLFIREHARARGDVDQLCRVFDTSQAATERRIADLLVG
jgi:Zn-dependent peptidase ImmA (M78 family)